MIRLTGTYFITASPRMRVHIVNRVISTYVSEYMCGAPLGSQTPITVKTVVTVSQ